MTRGVRAGRAIVLPALAAAVLSIAAPALARQIVATIPLQDLEADATPPAPVLVGGEPVIWMTVGAGPYSPQYRADRITQRLQAIVDDRSLRDPAVVVTETDASSELRVGPRLVMVLTQQDARALGVARPALAQQYARELEAAIRAERLRYAPATLVRAGLYGVLATLLLAAAGWVIQLLTRAARRAVTRWRWDRSGALRVQQAEILSAGGLGRVIERGIRLLRLVLLLFVGNLYLTYVLGLFPWTRAASFRLFGYVFTPIRAATIAFVTYLPKLVFVLVIATIIYFAMRLTTLFFTQIRHGRLVFTNFPAEWADPTNKIARVLLVAFGVVVAFPYLPASESPAFAGVSVFMGVLISLASSSALSNMIAGIVLTYTGAFRLGDRVKVGDAFGDIVQTSLLATHVRTIKNEDITIPNGLVLGGAVVNYSRVAHTLGLILHTNVTIGYDAPWRTVHDLLVTAALDTPGIRQEPRPFVWQTALNDFYVTYEINAFTAVPRDMIDIYAALHARIQDTFAAAGVEIMSPHYTSIRDGNAIAVPPPLRSPAYRAPAFRIEDVTTTARSSSGPASPHR